MVEGYQTLAACGLYSHVSVDDDVCSHCSDILDSYDDFLSDDKSEIIVDALMVSNCLVSDVPLPLEYVDASDDKSEFIVDPDALMVSNCLVSDVPLPLGYVDVRCEL